jgi:hypothetical protein
MLSQLKFSGKSMGQTLSLAVILFLSVMAHAARPDRNAFLATKEDIRCLAEERIRVAGADYERVVVAGENRIRALHETFRVEGGTPPTRLDGDLGELRGACQKMQKRVAAGRPLAADDRARQIIDRHWSLYRSEIDSLERQIVEKERERARAESQIYWETLRAFNQLKEKVRTDLLFNTPPGERGLEDALNRDEGFLLLACETTPKKTRGKDLRVIPAFAY